MAKNKICKSYVGLACIDGTCPMAKQDEYEEHCIPVVRSCKECHFYIGCEDCYFQGTEKCEKARK